jgi:hypothetical protein
MVGAEKSQKLPLVTGWQNGSAVSTREDIDRIFPKNATHAGIPTGDRSGLLVVDLDGSAAQTWRDAHRELLPETRTQPTQRGVHLYYRIAPGLGLRNSASKLAEKIDIRADGGYVVDWSLNYEPRGEIVEAPKSLIDHLRSLKRDSKVIDVDFTPPSITEGSRNQGLASFAGILRRDGLSRAEIEAALQVRNAERCDPPLSKDEVAKIAESISRYPSGNPAEDGPIEFLTLGTRDDILAPIPPEIYLLPGLVPAESYTLIAGALSSYKTTLLSYMLIWRATGVDLLGFSRERVDPGPVVYVFYEDPYRRIKARFNRILQDAYQLMEKDDRKKGARFLLLASANIHLVPMTGMSKRTLVRRDRGDIVPNDDVIEEILAGVRRFATCGVLIGLDPLRLAIVGSQNDDDGADVVVHTLNYFAGELDGSGLIVASHTTKVQARAPSGDGYAEAAYATSGSALYSQHARSNFHLTRLTAPEMRKFDLAPEEAERQPIARLTHGRLSHGVESDLMHFRMAGGLLVPIRERSARSASDQMRGALPIVIETIERLHKEGTKVSETALTKDEKVHAALGGKDAVKSLLKMLEENAYIEFVGKTKNRECRVLDKARQL